MSTSTFDTLAAVRTMETAGVPRPQAEAIASAMRNATEAQFGKLATKSELQAAINALRADLYRALWIQGVGIVAIVGALAALR